MSLLIDGRKTREALTEKLILRIKELGFVPVLAIIQVGDRPDSTAFIKAKKSFASKIGIKEKHIQLGEDISQSELNDTIKECNADSNIHGIIVQLPLPSHLDRDTTIEAIDPKKDVDALTKQSIAKWSVGKGILPATARGIRELLSFYDISLKGKNVTVIGRSELVGKPIAIMCKNEGASVTVCHSQTPDLVPETKKADIIICAVGKPSLIQAKHLDPNKKQIVIDVGINRTDAGTLVGDVDFGGVKDMVYAISPVPGGVGPMTVLGLFENLVDICQIEK